MIMVTRFFANLCFLFAVLFPAFAAAADTDGDGWETGEDCNDARADIHPFAVEICGDRRDSDCDERQGRYYCRVPCGFVAWKGDCDDSARHQARIGGSV